MRFHGQFGNILKVRETLCTIYIHTYTYGRHTLKKSFFLWSRSGYPPPYPSGSKRFFNAWKWSKMDKNLSQIISVNSSQIISVNNIIFSDPLQKLFITFFC